MYGSFVTRYVHCCQVHMPRLCTFSRWQRINVWMLFFVFDKTIGLYTWCQRWDSKCCLSLKFLSTKPRHDFKSHFWHHVYGFIKEKKKHLNINCTPSWECTKSGPANLSLVYIHCYSFKGSQFTVQYTCTQSTTHF